MSDAQARDEILASARDPVEVAEDPPLVGPLDARALWACTTVDEGLIQIKDTITRLERRASR